MFVEELLIPRAGGSKMYRETSKKSDISLSPVLNAFGFRNHGAVKQMHAKYNCCFTGPIPSLPHVHPPETLARSSNYTAKHTFSLPVGRG